MKQKKSFLYFLSFALLVSFAACKKDKTDDSGSSADISTHSDDQSIFTSEVDAISDDADVALEAGASVSGRAMGMDTIQIAGGYITWNLESDPQTATITYNGNNADGTRSRAGVVTVSVAKGTQWKNEGAAVSVNFNSVKITRLLDKKSITINGTQTYTNVSGGLLKDLSSLQHITHTIASDGLSITFDNGTQRSWKVAKKRDFTYDNGVVVAVSGNHTEGDVANIAEWGINRFGAAFTTATVTPLTIRQDCNFRLTSGSIIHTVGGITATATFGLDASGNAVSCPAGNFYYKVVYTGPNGKSITFILPY
ncbi:MAG: hypothetical protein QM802_21085 [Agriterribacter sp.]